MRLSSATAALVVLSSRLVNAASTFSPARPPAIPLAVKSPYLNSWLNAGSDGGNGGYLAGEWNTFWKYDFQGRHIFITFGANIRTANKLQDGSASSAWMVSHTHGWALLQIIHK
jgi:hypothetical protein